MQIFLPSQNFKRCTAVRNCIALLVFLILFVTNSYAQTASVLWPLTSDAVAIPSGNVTGSSQLSNGVGINTYVSDGVSSDNWAVAASQDAGKYYEFAISPVANYNLYVTDVSIDNNTDGISGTALIQYAYDAAFTSPVTVGSSFAISTSTSATTGFNALSVTVNNGQTLYIRVFAWNIENSSKLFNTKNFSVTGSTVLCLPDVSDFTTLTPTAICQSSSIDVTVNSSSLATDNYTITYDLNGANTATGLTAAASFTAGTPGSGMFTIPAAALGNTGNTNVTITSITNSNNCTSNLSTGNNIVATVTALPVATFNYTGSPYCSNAVNALPTFSGGGSAGAFSSTAGLFFVSTSTGEIDFAASTPGTYTVTNTITASGGCALVSATSDVTITDDNTVVFTSAIGTNAQTVCINTPVINITYLTTGATGATFSGLPTGVTGNWSADVVTISGTPSASGTFNYTVTLIGGCGTVTANGTIDVTANNTIALTSGIGTNSQALCINTGITDITYSTTGATGAGFSGLPAGVTGNWAANVVTITGTPTTSGVFNYVVTLTGSCGIITATGSINITANNIISRTSAVGTDAQTRCINTAITNITYSTTGASGATFSGLPTGVTGNWAANNVTISGTPSVNGIFNYTVTLTGGCGIVTATGSINVTANNTIALTSAIGTNTQTRCINTAITNITYSTTGATGATFANLPAGVTGSWAANVVTISGTPSASGTFNYTITTTGGCITPAVTATGSITVTANNTIALSSGAGTNNQTRCINTALANITFTTTGATGATFSGLPTGVTGSWVANVVTINGTPGNNGIFNYTVTTTGGCTTPAVTAGGAITVTANNTINRTSAAGTDAQTRCISTSISNITYSTTGATGATISGLPTGVTGSWAANVVTISGTPTASGTFNYTVTTTGGCTSPAVTATGSIIVTPNNTISLTSAVGSNAQTVCINSTITSITYSAVGATGATFAGLPTGITGSWAANVIAITGTPSVNGTFNYTVTLTGGCGTTTANGSVNVNTFPAATGVTICQNGAGSLSSTAACAVSTPVTAGPNFAGTGATGGGGGEAWANATRVVANDNSYTAVDIDNTSEALNATQFGFAIPASAVINGIQVTIGRYGETNNDLQDDAVRLIKAGVAVGNNYGATNTDWPGGNNSASEAPANYGATTDLWGTTWTPAQINATNFGVSLVVDNDNFNNRTAYVDYIQVRVTYTIPGTLGWYTVSSGGTAIGNNSPFNPVGVAGSGLANTSNPSTTTFYAECAASPGCRTAVDFLINPLPTISGNLTVCIGLTTSLTGSATPAAATPWVSSNTGVATVNSSGLVTGVSAGTSTITYTNSNNCSITATVTVSAPVISGTLNVCVGFTRPLTGNGTAAASNPWVSSNTSIATVNGSGVVTGIATGTVNITYTNNNGCFTTVSFTVNALPVVSITGTTAVCAGGPNSTTTLSPTTGGVWTSSNASIATVTNAGVVTGVAAGTATFTFTQTSTGCSNTTASVTVNARPAATFTTSPGANVCVNTNVTYTTQAGQSNYVWTVPGVAGTNYTIISGGTSSDNTVTLQWLTAGSKTVTVNYSNVNGCTSASAAAHTGNANARPTPTFTTAPGAAVCATTNVTYTTQTGQSSYVWSVPGIAGTDYTIISGGIGGANATVTLQWLTTGSKTVTVNYNNGSGCTGLSAASNTITVNARPIANIITGATAVCVGSTIPLASSATGAPALSYTWASSNGNATVTNAGIVTGVAAGTSNITYTVTDGNTCTATSPAFSVTINARPLPTISITPGSPICTNVNITYTTQPAMTNYTWTIPGVAGTDYTLVTGGTSTDNAVTVQWLTTGTKNVTVNYTNGNGCTAAVAGTSSTVVNARPTPTFTTQPGTFVCASGGVNTTDITYTTQTGQSNYVWTVPGISGTDYTIVSGGIGTTNNTVTLRWLTAGSKTVTVNYNNSNGCTALTAVSNTTTVNALPVVSTSASSVCVNGSITATPNSAGTWVSSNNSIATINNAGLINGVAAGTVTFSYTLTATGCVRTTAPVTVNPLPVISPITDGSAAICVNDITVFTNATAGGSWSIINGTGTANIDASGLVSGVSAGTVTVVYTFFNGTCTNSVSVPLTINPIPVVGPITGGAASVCVNANTPAFINATAGGTWSIINGSGTANVNASGVVTGLTAGIVTVVYTVDAGTCSNESAVSLTVNPLPIVAAISGGASNVCVNSTTPAFSNPTPSGVWSITNGTGTASITASGVVTGLTAGTVTVVYTINNGTCSNTASQLLTVNPLPVIAGISGGASSVCIGSVTPAFTNATPGGVWSISNGTGTASITTGGVVTGLTTGTVNIIYTVNTGGCTDFVSVSVSVNALPIANAITGTNTVCAASNINLTSNASGTGSLTYTWSSSDNSVAIVDNAGMVTGVDAGTSSITYTVSDGNGCSATSSPFNITVNARPIANITSGSTTICDGNAVAVTGSVTATGAWTLTLSNGATATGIGNGTFNISVSPAVTTPYTVLSLADANCTAIAADLTGSTIVTVNDNVIITTQPLVSQTVCSGNSVSISVAATGTGLTYQWRKGLTPLVNGGNISGVGTSTLVLNPVTVADAAADYNVVITGASPCASVTSDNATLIVNEAVSITTQPITKTECTGNSVSFTVTATGSGVSYQWRKNGSPIADGGNIAGANTTTLTLTNLAAADAGNYTVTVTGLTPCVPVTSSIAVLTVNTAVAITTQPSDAAVCATLPVTFTVAATGAGLTYQWYKGTFPGTIVTNNANISGATTASLHFNQANVADINDYYVIVTGLAPCVTEQSDYAHLAVDQTITITQQPTAQTVCSGSDVQFVVVASAGVDPLLYQWKRNGSDIPGATDDTLNIIGATAVDAGNYSVEITGIAGCITSFSSAVALTVNPLSVGGTVNTSAIVCGGVNSGTLTLTGQTGNVVRWEFSSDGGTLWTPIVNSTTTQSYTNLTMETMYRAVVKSGLCVEDNSAAATISFYPVPDATTTTASQTVCSGLPITTIAFSGSVPSTTFNWTRNNTAAVTGIAASGSGNIAASLINTTLSPVTVTFTITPIANGCSGTAITATVTVDPSPDAVATPSAQIICSGETISTIVLSSTVVSPTFSWTRNNNGTVTGIAASGSGNIAGALTNTTSAPVTVTFTIVPTAAGCDGSSITATVVVNPTANAIATPSSQTICSGQNITGIVLSSAVSGTTYTWTRDNSGSVTGIASSGTGDITGSLTNTTLSPITVTFTITPGANGCPGTAITATVLVNPSPDAIATPSAQPVCTGSAITTIVLSSAVPAASYTWTRNSLVAVTGMPASGSGNISGSLTNNTASPVVVTFTITPTANGCPGTPITATVTVNPGPNVTATPSSQAICSSASISTIVITSSTPSAIFNWTRNNTATVTGIAASGTGDISGSLTNSTNAAITVTFTITSDIGGCPGSSVTATVLVRPIPTIGVTNNIQTVCGSVALATMVVSNPNAVSGTSFSWTRNNTTDLTGIAAGGTGNISGTLTNNTSTQQITIFTITATANGCTSSTTATVTVNPRPVMTSANTARVCNNAAVNIPLTSATPSTFTWIAANNGNVTGESTTTQNTNTINNTLVNTSASPGGGPISLTPRQNVTYTVTPTASGTGCAGVPQTVTVTVNPPYNISYYEYPNDDNLFAICDGDLVGGGGQNDMDLIEGQYSGAALLWQYSIGSNTGPWSTVPGPHVNNAIHDTLPPAPSIFSPMGNYYFRLLVEGCPSDIITMTKTSTLTIQAGADRTVCESGTPSAITLTGASVGGTASTTVGGTWSVYAINPGNGNVNGTFSTTAFVNAANVPNVTYTPPAFYTGVVTLLLTSNDPDGNGPCSSLIDTLRINVSQAPIAANPSAVAICSGDNTNINLTSVVPSTYTWTVGTITGGITGASAGSGNTIGQVLTNPGAAAGTVQYIITPTAINPATCAAVTSSITVTVRPLPSPSLTRSPATVCSGSASVLTATNTGGTLNSSITGSNLSVQNISSSGTPTITSSIALPAGTITAASSITLTMNLTHSYAGDLTVTLISPSCGSSIIFNRPGGTNNNNNLSGNYTFTSVSGNTFPSNNNPITAQTYNANFAGISFPCTSAAGNWILQITDNANQDGGSLNSWSLSINTNGVYTSVFNGPATIGAVAYTGAGNTTATASVTPPVGTNNYTVTTTDAFGCSNTSSSVSITVNAPPTITAATQQASVCAGSAAQMNLTGLAASSTSTVTYRINAGATQTITGVVADASGNASFNTILLTAANNGQILQVTSLTTTSASPACAQLFTRNVTLSVNATPTLTGAVQPAAVCPGSSAQINLSGLVPNNIISVTYTINGGSTETATNISVSAGGTANFTTVGLTTANNGQTLQVTGVSITSALPNCSQSFTRNVTLAVHPSASLSSTLMPSAICSGSIFSYVPAGSVAGSSFTWSRAVVPGISQPANSGTGNISETLTNTTSAPVTVTFNVTISANGCSNSPGENVILTVNPAPSLATVSQSAIVCAGTGATMNLTGLIPGSTSTIFYSINGISQPSVAGVVSNASGVASFISANLTAANNGQILRVTGISTTSNAPACARTFSIITLLNVNAIPTLSAATQAAAVCLNGPATINISGLVPNSTNNTINYSINGVAQTPVTGVNANVSGAASFNTIALTAANNGQTLQVTGITNGTCSQIFTQNVTLTVGTVNTWIGVNTNWFDIQNWCAGIPTSTTDVLIPGSLANYPLLNTGTGSVRNIVIQNTASVTVSGAVLQIAGAVTNAGAFNATSGTIELNGIAGTQNISGSMFAQRMLDGLIISNTSGVNVSAVAGDTLNIADSLSFGTVSNAVLNTGDNITLLSSAAKTARVSDITNGGANTGNSFSGKVIVERYIPQRRSWRVLSVPLQQAGSQTFNAAWQEGVVNPDYVYANHLDPHPGYGMLITGPTSGAGFDPSPMNNYSILGFNPITLRWAGVPNTLTAKVTDSAGYMVFVRGDRATQIYLNTAAPISNTILRASGFLKTNLQTTSVPAGVGTYSLVGNPYASSIDLRTVTTSGGVSGTNYVVWDPALTGANGVGAYQYLTRSGGPGTDYLVFPGNTAAGGGSYGAPFSVNNNIQSGQAFLVQNAGAGTVSINENAKIIPTTSTVFRPASPATNPVRFAYISTLLMYENGHIDSLQLVDGALMMYNNSYSNDIDLEDAKKMSNMSSESFGINNGDNWMQIEKRSGIESRDTIFFKAKSYRERDYQFRIEAANIEQDGLTAFLEDAYLHTSTPVSLNGTTVYRFKVFADSGAWRQDRFKIVFKQNIVLPVTFSSVKAYRNNDFINVEWKTAHELSIANYDVERSADGIRFEKVYTETNVMNNDRGAAYSWVDKNPLQGINFYRVKSKEINGAGRYTSIVKVAFDKPTAQSITLYPNPLIDATFNLYFVNEETGNYKLRLLNSAGQLIEAAAIKHAATSPTEVFRPTQQLLHGTYMLEITKPGGAKQTISAVY